MQEALIEAEQAAIAGDVPVGAVLVDIPSGQLLGRGQNRREQDQDPVAHAEIVAMRSAALSRGHWRLDQTVLYVTLEPCAMCSGAIINSRIPFVVFGAFDKKAGCTHSLLKLGEDGRFNHRFQYMSGVLEEESVKQLQSFFRKLREAGEK